MEELIDFNGADVLVQRTRDIRLPAFWVEKPAAWFALAEARFRSGGVELEQHCFDLLVGAMSMDSIGQVIDLIENPPDVLPYSTLKAKLLMAHQLTDYQRLEVMFQMEPLGARKPTELLNLMLETCPRGHSNNIFFTHMFMRALPAELRIMLGEDDHQDSRALAEKADRLWALHGPKQHLLANVSEPAEPSPVAAVQQRGKVMKQKFKRASHQSVPQHQVAQAGGQQATPSVAPSQMARMGSGLCHFHWCYGDKAKRCEAPCNWQGN